LTPAFRVGHYSRLVDACVELVPTSLAATRRQAYDVSGMPVLITEHGADFDDDRDDLRCGPSRGGRARSRERIDWVTTPPRTATR
jgi:hypothetical protein